MKSPLLGREGRANDPRKKLTISLSAKRQKRTFLFFWLSAAPAISPLVAD
jgi:hypothetical protein